MYKDNSAENETNISIKYQVNLTLIDVLLTSNPRILKSTIYR